MRTSSEIVNYLVRHYQDKNGETDANLLPEQIDDLIGQMGEFLKARIHQETPHKRIWESFVNHPEDNAPSLTGILEVLFEAQPAVRERVDGFMRKVTAIEVENSDHAPTPKAIENDLKAQAGGLMPDEDENSAILADRKVEKNPPAYLYGNERQGFESDREAPVSKPFMVGKNAQIIYIPEEDLGFPSMFEHLGHLSEISKDLNLQEKQSLQENLHDIHLQLIGKQPFDDGRMADALEAIWEIAPSYANVLIESLQNNINHLPLETRDFIIQLHTPLH